MTPRSQETALLTYYYQFIIKDTTQEQPNGRDAQRKVWGKRLGVSISSLGEPPSQHLHVFTKAKTH